MMQSYKRLKRPRIGHVEVVVRLKHCVLILPFQQPAAFSLRKSGNCRPKKQRRMCYDAYVIIYSNLTQKGRWVDDSTQSWLLLALYVCLKNREWIALRAIGFGVSLIPIPPIHKLQLICVHKNLPSLQPHHFSSVSFFLYTSNCEVDF